MPQNSLLCDGQIIIRERNTSTVSTEEILYVKPQAQTDVVIYNPKTKKGLEFKEYLARLFLPAGFPDSVSKDYLAYQIWDSAQAFCSTITGTLATHEVLKGVGVGNVEASPLAATITWVIKDGSGHIGRILFAASHGPLLDAYSKKWRLYADTFNDAAMCIEMALPLLKNYTLFALCVCSFMKAIVGVAGGATRAALTQHHAIRGNMADVSAKDSAQETAVNLIASIAAICIITVFGNSLFVFFIMMILHIVFNYLAVRAICLRTLNEPRFLELINTYLRHEVIETPCLVNSREPVISYQLGPDVTDFKMSGFRIKIGQSLKHMFQFNKDASHFTTLIDVYQDRNYILYPKTETREMFIYLDNHATTNDILCAYFHAVLLSIITCALNDVTLPVIEKTDCPRPFTSVCNILQTMDWSRDPAKDPYSLSGFEYQPSIATMVYVDKIAQNEWSRIKKGLTYTGWDLSKHLLVIAGWHFSRKDVSVTEISPSLTLENDNSFEKLIPNVNSTERRTYAMEPNTSSFMEFINGKLTIKNPLDIEKIMQQSNSESSKHSLNPMNRVKKD